MPVGPYWIETSTPGRLAILPRPRGGDWLEDEAGAWSRAGIDIVVSLLTPEEDAAFDLTGEGEACRKKGIEFRSFPIRDRDVPDSRAAATELVTYLAEQIRLGSDIGFHCRQGVGRSAMLAAAVLVALDVEPERAIARVATARGLPVPETVEQRRWITDFARPVIF
jgi:hypothetical protein